MKSELSEYGERQGNQQRRCLSLTVSGPWGHFRRVDGNTIKATYRIMPRTTVAGLLAAVAGYDRDDYYDVFARGRSGIAIQPLSSLRTINLPVNSLTTSDEGMKSVNARGKVSIRYPDPTKDRQRTNYEVLVDPAYRIDVWLEEDEAFNRLHSMLTDGKSYYTPSLGLSEYLAEITNVCTNEIEPVTSDKPISVDSAIPDSDGIVPEPETAYNIERSPAYMTQTSEHGEFSSRRTTGFLTYTYSPDKEPLAVTDVEAARVGDRTVVFA